MLLLAVIWPAARENVITSQATWLMRLSMFWYTNVKNCSSKTYLCPWFWQSFGTLRVWSANWITCKVSETFIHLPAVKWWKNSNLYSYRCDMLNERSMTCLNTSALRDLDASGRQTILIVRLSASNEVSLCGEFVQYLCNCNMCLIRSALL